MMQDNLEFESSEEDLQHLREWIAKSPQILQHYDKKFLSAFVKGCKGNLQKTKKVLEAFNSLGQRYPKILKNYDPTDKGLVDSLSEAFMFFLPKKSPDGSNVLIFSFRYYEGFKSDPYKFHSPDFYRYWLLSLYSLLWKSDFGTGKFIFVVNCKAATMAHTRECTPKLVQEGTEMMLNAFPIRIQAVHLLNLPPYLEYLSNFAKSLVKKKYSERLFIHKTVESLYKQCPKDILPKDYGGSDLSSLILHEQWYETVCGFRKEFLEEESKMRALDQFRSKTDDAQEMVGTFKSLNVD